MKTIKDFFGIDVQVGDYVLTDAIGPAKGNKCVSRVARIADKSVFVKMPAVIFGPDPNGYARYIGPFYENFLKDNPHSNRHITTKEWSRQWFVKLNDEQIQGAVNTPFYYGDL